MKIQQARRICPMSVFIDFLNEARYMSFVPGTTDRSRPIFSMPPFPSKFFCYGDPKIEVIAERAHICAIAWEDIVEYQTVLIEHKDYALKMVWVMLGYTFWSERHRYRSEIKIRRLTERYNKKELTDDEYLDDVSSTLKELRNLDMRVNNFCKLEHSERDIRRYAIEDDILYSNDAREKLAHFLGYYPDLKYSLEAELYLRSYMSYTQKYFSKEDETDAVVRAMTIVKYREVLLHDGQEAADRSPLVGIGKLREVKAAREMSNAEHTD